MVYFKKVKETLEERLRREKLTTLFGPKTARAIINLPEEIPAPTEDIPLVVEALRKHATLLLEKHAPLRIQISAEGGAAFGENTDPRLKDWGEKFETIQSALVELARKMPSLFPRK